MSLLPLLAALLPWAVTPAAAVTRVFLAVSLLSLEMQVVTLAGVGSLSTLVPLNLGVAVVATVWQARRASPSWFRTPAWRDGVPRAALLALFAVVLGLNAWRPIEAADPYHLDRVAQIERYGTLAYDPGADPKVNVVGWVYQLVLADLHQVPAAGAWFVRLHGVLGLLLCAAALAAVRASLPGGPRWPWTVLLVVPPLFHQLVLIKNDLFLAVPALLALGWLVRGSDLGSWRAAAWAGWLAGIAVAGKVLGFPVALVLLGGVALGAPRPDRWRALGGLVLGGATGAVTGGLVYSWTQNARWYGDALASQAMAEIGNVSTSFGEAVESLGRFGLSLVDLGQVTPVLWPGRGGWGGTLGLPLVWAVVVLAWRWRASREARVALVAGAVSFGSFAALFPDADLSHRLVLAPGLLVVATAAHVAATTGTAAAWPRSTLVPVPVLSAAQILRSAALYVVR